MEECQEWSLPATSYNEDADIKGSDLGHSVLSEFEGADRKSFSRTLLLSSPGRKGSLLENSANVHLEARLVKIVDNSDNQKDPAISGRTFADITKHDARYPRKAAVPPMHQTDLLNKPRVDIETSLIDHVCNDNAERLVCWLQSMVQVLKVDGEGKSQKQEELEALLGFWFPHRLLQLACQLDSVACAEALLEGETGLLSPVNAVDEAGKTALHFAASQLATRCINLLLKKRAKADMPSQDGCIPLKAALQSKRWPKDLQTLPANDIITILSKQDLTALRLLIDHTKDVLRLAYHLASDGDAAGLAALLLAAGKSFLGNVHKYESFLDLAVERTLSCRRGNTNSGGLSEKDPTKFCNTNEIEDEVYKSSILKSLEIIVRLKRESVGSLSHCPYRRQGKGQSALLKAAQAGDEEVIKILLNDTSNVNEVDSDGNTALHWCLKTTKGLRIVWQLVTHGSLVSARNRLGLTPVHIAAGQGHLQALQLLLAQDPSAVHIATVTKETPLFSAVKNNHAECVKLLLQFGSNLQVLNLRKQRPVDFASSQEMRMILSESGRRATGKAQVNSDSKSCNSNKNRHQSQAKCVIPNVDDGADFNEVQIINRFIETQDDLDNSENWMLRTQHAKTALCRYHMMPGGCARGDGCFYAHGEQELRPEAREKACKVNNVFDRKKIFVGGLLPAMGSDDLKNCFEAEFGPVQEAIVMNSQTGGHIQSRGFGFVTFKNEASCIAAVKQHYLTICSKRVEIKAAFQSSKRTDEEMLSFHLSNTPAVESDRQEALKRLSWSNMTTGEISMSVKNEASTNLMKSETAAICQAESVSLKRCNPPWLAVFKKWLPEFLSSVYRRQRGVEYYPLSAVKADFRATCGMELDHMALGFPKLSDFLRTMPELCRMKIVPVGRGPATHVVLRVRQQSLVPKTHQATFATKLSTSSLVHEGRTYAAAASYNIASSSETKKEVQNTDCEDLILLKSQSNIVNDSSDLDYSSCAHNFSGPASGFKDSTVNIKDKKQPAIVDSNKLSLFSTFNTEESHQQKLPKLDAFRVCQQGLAGNRLAAPEDVPPNSMWASITNSQFRSVTPAPCTTQPPPQQHVPTFSDMYHNPYMERTIPNSVFSETALPALYKDIAPFYNPWNSNTFEGCRNLIQQMNLAATGEESPQSSLTSEDSLDSPQTLSEVSSHPCVLCGDKAAVWVAIPCTHKAICSHCKTQLHTSNWGLRQCFICQGIAREWIAQYH